MVKQALISVSDKTGVVEFAARSPQLGIELLSTGGTAKLLADGRPRGHRGGRPTPAFPRCSTAASRRCTRRIHGGLLARRASSRAHEGAAGARHRPIDLLVREPVSVRGDGRAAGLHASTRRSRTSTSAARRWCARRPRTTRSVAVVTDPAQYGGIARRDPSDDGGRRDATRFALAMEAFARTSHYDGAICDYLSVARRRGTRRVSGRAVPARFVKVQDLRYGENPHQNAAFYRDLHPAPGLLAG